jgi:hypothetical protein
VGDVFDAGCCGEGEGCGTREEDGVEGFGSRPRLHSPSASNMIPELVLKHSCIIQRNGIRARLVVVSLETEAPPTSA